MHLITILVRLCDKGMIACSRSTHISDVYVRLITMPKNDKPESEQL